MSTIFIDDDGSLHELPDNAAHPGLPIRGAEHNRNNAGVIAGRAALPQTTNLTDGRLQEPVTGRIDLERASARKRFWGFSSFGSICSALLMMAVLSGIYAIVAPICALVGPLLLLCYFMPQRGLKYSTKEIWMAIGLSLLCGFGGALIVFILPYILILALIALFI